MKTGNQRTQLVLELLLETNLLREDCALIAKISCHETNRIRRSACCSHLASLQAERTLLEQSLAAQLQGLQLNEQSKSQLFHFSSRLYKQVKQFQQKLNALSPKLAELADTTPFLTAFRAACIEHLATSPPLAAFLRMAAQKLQARYAVESQPAAMGKVMEVVRREEAGRQSRYLGLMGEIALLLECHRRANQRIRKMLQGMNCRTEARDLLSDVMELEETEDDAIVMQNGMVIGLNYREEGLCEFVLSRWGRLLKEMKSRNAHNQHQATHFANKYEQHCSKPKTAQPPPTPTLPTPTPKTHTPCLPLTTPPLHACRPHDSQPPPSASVTIIQLAQMALASTIDMRDLSLFVQGTSATPQMRETKQEDNRKGQFRMGKGSSRKRAHTLRPLGESKENKEVVPQKVMEMRLSEEPPQLSKLLRIRRRRPFPALREDNGWSLLLKENQGKMSFFIH